MLISICHDTVPMMDFQLFCQTKASRLLNIICDLTVFNAAENTNLCNWCMKIGFYKVDKYSISIHPCITFTFACRYILNCLVHNKIIATSSI